MRTIKIRNMKTLEQLKNRLASLNPEQHKLFFDDFDVDLYGYRFTFEGHVFQVTYVDCEENEIPLITAFRIDIGEHIGAFDDHVMFDHNTQSCNTDETGYYSLDTHEYTEFQSIFMNHSNWNFIPDGYYSWNVPGIDNNSLVGVQRK
jgi:hypothetical protein